MNTIDNKGNPNPSNNGNPDADLDLDLDLDENGEGDKGKDKGQGRQESDEDRLARHERQAARLRKKLGKDENPNPNPNPEKKPNEPSQNTDMAEKAYMLGMGLKTDAEMQLAKKAMADSGKTLDQVLVAPWFQSDLAEHRTQSAVPTDKGRSGNPSATDTVDYWIKKGELPPNTPENTKLRQDVVNARIKAEKAGSVFSPNPVVR